MEIITANKVEEKRKSIQNRLIGYKHEYDDAKSNKEESVGVNIPIGTDNIVSGEKLRQIQSQTLASLKNYLSKTFGPMGSNTKIIKGSNSENISSIYSKDGLKVLQNIKNSGPIEMSIIEEIIEITRHVEKEVGDGTTSTVILSSLIFDKLMILQKKYNVPPFQLIRLFSDIVEEIKENILDSLNGCLVTDIYNISMISTNGNEKVSNEIRDIYEKYGMNVNLSVGISNSSDSIIKEYDGLTITEGMSDPVYITNKEQSTSEIYNPKIYHFADPIDTMDMISLFDAIIDHNIYEAYQNDEPPIPTVITCPRISRDMSATLKQLATTLYQFDNAGNSSSKPPILIITNVVASDELIMDDIANLCGCKSIRKYIDPKMLERDRAEGKAPTIDNVFEFAGDAELVIADMKKTKFINPAHMHKLNKETEEFEEDPIYTAMINFLKTEIANANETGETSNEIGLLEKRLSALEANTVDYLVGGITVAERDAQKDLIEDAIKNCSSAAKYGVGRAANFEGLIASYMLLNSEDMPNSELYYDIISCIFESYCEISEILYGTVCSDENEVKNFVNKSLERHVPYNISNGFIVDTDDISEDCKVACSIMLDVNILDTISKIITIMVTSNQCLLQVPQLNQY